MKNIPLLIVTAFALLLISHESLSQQTSTLKLKFSLIDSVGDTIKPGNSNYIYVDYWNGDEMSLIANNDHIRYDTVSSMFVVTITVPRYNEYSFILKNKYRKESMVFRITMNGNISEELTLDVIQFTPGLFVFNLKEDTNYYNIDDLEIKKCFEHGENGRCYEIKHVDWGNPQAKQGK